MSHHLVDSGQSVGFWVPEGSLEQMLQPGTKSPVSTIHDHGQVLGDNGGLSAGLQLQVGGDGHVDCLPGGRDSVQHQRVVQGTVPGCLEPEHGPIISRNLENLSRKQSQRENASIFIIINQTVRSGSDPPHHQLPHISPPQICALVNYGQPDQPIRNEYFCESTNQKKVLEIGNQSEVSISVS